MTSANAKMHEIQQLTPGWRVHVAAIFALCGLGMYSAFVKSILSSGVNTLVYAVYRAVVGLILLVLYAFFAERRQIVITWRVVGLYAVLGFFGTYLFNVLYLDGVSLSSAEFADSLLRLVPLSTFIVAAISGVEEIRYKHRDGIAKVVGFMLSGIGAMTLSLNKGPGARDPSTGYHSGRMSSFVSRDWKIGVLYLVASTFCRGVYTNLLVPTMKLCPAPATLVASQTLFGSIVLVITGILQVRDTSQWVLTPTPQLILVFTYGLIAEVVCQTLVAYVASTGGPVILAAYGPLQAILGVLWVLYLTGDGLFLTWGVGTVAIAGGFCLILWGRYEQRYAKESELLGSSPDLEEPLLR